MARHSEGDGDQKKRKRSEETELGRKHSKRRKDRPVAGNETAPNHVSAPPKNGAVTPEADNEGSDGRRTNGESGSKDKRRHKKSKAQELAANVVEPPVHVPIPQEVAIVAAESEDEDKLETVVNGQSMERSEGSQQLWRLSKPMGGRMSDIDPIFTADEKHLILVYNTSLQVYTTADSLLVRRIPINLNASSLSDRDSANATIIAASLSPTSPNHVYVAVSDGRIFKLDWTRGNEAEQKTPEPLMRTKRNHVADMAVAALPFRYSTSGGVSAEEDVALRDVLFVVEQDTSESVVTWYFTTYLESDSAAARKNPKQKTKGKGKRKADPSEDVGSESESEDQQRLYKRLYKFKPDQAGGIPLVRTFDSGRIVIGACGNVLFLGALESVGEPQMFGSVSYTFFSLSSLDLITSVDARIQTRPRGGSSSGQLLVNGATHIEETDTVDVVVGGVRGTLLVYSDLLAKLQRPGVPLAEGERRAKEPLEPRKYHWHRKAVYGVKWSRDGNYIISGGTERALVLWQVDTGKRSFLPYLSAIIQNVVVSPSGSSYALHLDDNSAMLISTADMKPTFYVSGLQSLSFKDSRPKDTMVTRVWQHGVTVPYPSPAIISPKEPSTMLLCVGSGAQGPEDGSQPSAPLIQSFDLSTFQSRWKQALTRTNATDFDITSQGLPIVEPRVSHLAAAGDGTWIASIDEWAPSQKIDSMPEVLQGGKEVFLKFWDAAADSSEMRLMSRINSPHQTDLSGVVLDLSGDPTSNRFATLGDDSTVQLWRPRRRQRDGIDAKDDKGNVLQTWSCSQTIVLGETAGIRQDEVLKPSAGRLVFSEDGSALFAAYTRALDVDSMSDTSLTASMETVDVYVVDCALGQVRHVLPQLAHGTVRGLASLGRSVVVLTTRELVVYDVVADELVYGVSVGSGDAAIPGWATPYVHLAADSRSGTFAVAIPLVDETSASTQTQLDRTTPTELAVFDPEKLGGVTGPLAVHRLPHSLLNLVAGASAGAGYVAVDVLAQVWTVAEARNADALVVAKPLADMDLDTVELDGVSLDRGADDGDDDDMRDVAMGGVDGEEEDEVDLSVHAAVVTQQKLTEIFDVGPGSASLSIEDMFYSVAKLFAPKPLKRATDGDTVTAAA